MINIHIERLILDGVSADEFDPAGFRAAVGAELARTVGGEMTPHPDKNARPSTLAATQVAAAVRTQLSNHVPAEGRRQ